MTPDTLLSAAEDAITAWLAAHGATPQPGLVEGYRLLALHRQAAGIASNFLACRETCRELIYQINCASVAADTTERARRLRLADMAGTHLALFVAGSLETAGLGTFCCAARPLHAPDAAQPRS